MRPLGVRGTPGEVRVDGSPRQGLQVRIGPVDVDREPLLQVLQFQLYGVLGFQMLQYPGRGKTARSSF